MWDSRRDEGSIWDSRMVALTEPCSPFRAMGTIQGCPIPRMERAAVWRDTTPWGREEEEGEGERFMEQEGRGAPWRGS